MLTRTSLKPLISLIAIAFTSFQIFYTTYGVLEGNLMRVIFVAFCMVLTFLIFPMVKPKNGKSEPAFCLWIDFALSGLAILIAVYFIINNIDLMSRMRFIDELSPTMLGLGFLAIALTCEMARRTVGMPIVIIALTFLVYMFWGDLLPRAFKHNGFTLDIIIEQLFLLDDGIYGIPISVSTTIIFGFIMFGAFLERSNMTNIFMELACLLTRNTRGGPAKVAIFASAMFGTFSGSAAANVYGSGIFTIPLMKKVGYRPAFAGAVEAVSSTGGQLMPPVMGAAAFLMADLAGVPYLEVAKAALLPAILYYLSLFFMIHFEAIKCNLGVTPPELIPEIRHVLSRSYYLLPIVILIALMCMGQSITFCANMATLSIPFLALLSRESRFSLKGFFGAMELAARNILVIGSCCACAGIIIGAISLTGVGYKFISLITTFAGDDLFLLCICLMVTSFILGMGIPTAPAYIVVATLGAPALIKAGLMPIAAHMFVFYYAILSVITPPVCIAAFAGAAIAEARPMETGFVSLKLAVVAFVVPFMFIFAPAIIGIGSMPEIILAVVTSCVGVVALAAGMQGYLFISTKIWERICLVFSGFSLIFPGVSSDIAGGVLIAVVILAQFLRKPK